MQLSHTVGIGSAQFDDGNLVASAGVVPVMALARAAGLDRLADEHVRLGGDTGAHAGDKVASLVAGMVMGADSIDDMAVLRHGAMGAVYDRLYAPSTLGSFLRSFSYGHSRQLSAVATRLLGELCQGSGLLDGIDDSMVMVDIDDTVIGVYGQAKQGAAVGYTGVRGLNGLFATITPAHGGSAAHLPHHHHHGQHRQHGQHGQHRQYRQYRHGRDQYRCGW